MERRKSGKPLAKGRPGAQKKFKPLPPIKPPAIPPDHRAVLVACSATGRASWAEFAPTRGGYRWVKNVPAVPDMGAIRGRAGAGGGGAADPGASSRLPAGRVDWGAHVCGVCATGSPIPGVTSPFFQCANCATLYCAGGYEKVGYKEWATRCPGCGEVRYKGEHEAGWTIGEYAGASGSAPRDALGPGARRGTRRPDAGPGPGRQLPGR